MRGTKEFYEMRDQFEKGLKTIPGAPSAVGRVSREDADNVPKNVFYNNGLINQLFLAYMLGYSNGKSV